MIGDDQECLMMVVNAGQWCLRIVHSGGYKALNVV